MLKIDLGRKARFEASWRERRRSEGEAAALDVFKLQLAQIFDESVVRPHEGAAKQTRRRRLAKGRRIQRVVGWPPGAASTAPRFALQGRQYAKDAIVDGR